jgi:DegV family protein with EDD domain
MCIRDRSYPDRVTVVDSRSISAGYGVLALKAARLAFDGADVSAIVQAVNDMRARTMVRFFLESLDQVQRGGRLDALMPMLNRLGRALNIRAVLTINDEGRISLVGPARGRRGAKRRLMEDALATAPVEMLAVAHTRRPEEAAAVADDLCRQIGFPRAEVMLIELGTVLIAHAGEGTLAVATVRQGKHP